VGVAVAVQLLATQGLRDTRVCLCRVSLMQGERTHCQHGLPAVPHALMPPVPSAHLGKSVGRGHGLGHWMPTQAPVCPQGETQAKQASGGGGAAEGLR